MKGWTAMFDWARSLFRKKTRPWPHGEPPAPRASPDRPSPSRREKTAYRLSPSDAVHIEQALEALCQIGLRPLSPAHDFKKTSEAIARHWEGVRFVSEPTRGDWALFALSGADSGAFANAIYVDDNSFDVAGADDLAQVIGGIVGMASRDWPIDDIWINDGSPAKAEVALDTRYEVTIVAADLVAPFALRHDKYFDWSLISRLNERLPSRVTKKFAIFPDGNMTIVFLEPDAVRRLNEYCGRDFSYADE